MKIEMLDPASLVPYPRNAKLHPVEQIERLAQVIQTNGWDQPIVVDGDLVIIKGHGRQLAALKLGLSLVPVMVRSDLTKAQANAARISDNAVFGLSFDTRTLQAEIHALMATEGVIFTAEDLGLAEKDKKLLLGALDVAAMDVVMQDTHGEIEAQKDDDAERIAKSDAQMIPLADAFGGVKRISRKQARAVQRFMAEIEAETGKTGFDALVSFLEAR